MSYLYEKFEEARSLLGRPQPTASATDAIKHDSFDGVVFRELLDEAPALSELAYEDLGQRYDYTEDVVRDVLMEFWQADPELRSRKEMRPEFLLNHCVADDIFQAPETVQTRMFTKHDRYGAAMATIAVAEKIKDSLDKAQEAKEAAEAAAEAEKQMQQAMQDLMDALGCFPGGIGSPGDGEGDQEGGVSGPVGGQEGPLTGEQQAALEALEAAIQNAIDTDLTYEQTLAEAQEEAEKVGVALRPDIREAVEEAGNMLAEEQELFSTWGVEDGTLKRLSFEDRKRLARSLKQNRLNEFRKLIGRMRTMASAQRSKKVEYARDEAYDVEMSDRLPDVLASEFALLTNQHTRLDFLERLAEGQLLSKKYRGIEKIGDGGIYCLVDNSGSMTMKAGGSSAGPGPTREAYAKAMALALLDSARAAGRDFVGINFSSGSQMQAWHFPKGQGDISQVLDFIEQFYGGGTSYEAPIDLAMDMLEEEMRIADKIHGDIVIIGDDDVLVGDAWLARYQTRKEKLGFRTFGVAVGVGAGNALNALCAPDGNARSVMQFVEPTQVADIFRTIG